MNQPIDNLRLAQTTENWKQFHWYLQYLIVAVGLLVLLSSSYALYRGIDIYRKYFPLVKASMEMRLNATTSYLWFEEMLGGDRNKNLKDILEHLDLADWYATAMLEGGENPQLTLLPLKEEALLKRVGALKEQLARQRKLLIQRAGIESNSGPGSTIDQIYHATLEEFITDASDFEVQVEGLIFKDFRRFSYIGTGVIFFSAFLFLIVGYAFYQYERLRRKNYSEIVDMQDMLIHSEKMAALGTMMAGIAHEVNNPNTFISLNTPLLRDHLKAMLAIMDPLAETGVASKVMDKPYDQFKEESMQLVDRIENGSSRIARTVSTLLNFSRNKNKLKAQWFKIREVVDSALSLCGPKLNRAAGSLNVNIAENIPEKIFFDPEVLELSLINLLNNAAEAVDGPESRINLKVACLSGKANGATVIEVADNGSGIKESDLQRIFEPFFSTKSSKGGAGLGLYLCYSLLHQLGASIEVDSEVGSGSTFRIVIADSDQGLDEMGDEITDP